MPCCAPGLTPRLVGKDDGTFSGEVLASACVMRGGPERSASSKMYSCAGVMLVPGDLNMNEAERTTLSWSTSSLAHTGYATSGPVGGHFVLHV